MITIITSNEVKYLEALADRIIVLNEGAIIGHASSELLLNSQYHPEYCKLTIFDMKYKPLKITIKKFNFENFDVLC